LGVGCKHNGLGYDLCQFITVVFRDGEGRDIVNSNIDIGGGGSERGERVATNWGSFVESFCKDGKYERNREARVVGPDRRETVPLAFMVVEIAKDYSLGKLAALSVRPITTRGVTVMVCGSANAARLVREA
jgi:hypothetical protein